jgi:hypothetical protein
MVVALGETMADYIKSQKETTACQDPNQPTNRYKTKVLKFLLFTKEQFVNMGSKLKRRIQKTGHACCAAKIRVQRHAELGSEPRCGAGVACGITTLKSKVQN